jgi:hypothetical protein
VASAFGEPQGRLVEKQGRNTAKKVAIYLMKRYTCVDNKEIGQVFGGLHYSFQKEGCHYCWVSSFDPTDEA